MNSYSELSTEASHHLESAKHKMAVALAIRDGVLEEDEAQEYLKLDAGLERLQSDHYPGDEYYDKAYSALEGKL